MKRHVCLILFLAALFYCSGCRTAQAAPAPTPEATPVVTQSPAPTATPVPEAPAVPTPEHVPTPEPEALCTLSITCGELLDRLDELDEGVRALVPADGTILAATEVSLEAGESVFDVLRRLCRDHEIHLEFSNTPAYGSAYIEGIGNLYETDCGPLSGWSYTVNGETPNVGCSQYVLEPGDVVCWAYHCELSM